MRVSFFMGDYIDGILQCLYYVNGSVEDHSSLSNYFPFNLEYSFDIYIDNYFGVQAYQLFVYDKDNHIKIGNKKDRTFSGPNGFVNMITYMLEIESEISKIY
ncbi:hypothetical protein FDI40_gp350 [Agrobacterium phage Atu_ph07]|uniref:Uncharacterized protein n=1 Tax=Agrobacterium phage Atu_ph07 TaxID=2024264 RepID=A0A2L0V000_9CAUD|nr:hypothetical protein FDI40_gp350 [Agrobacterium phage Atu_ph07]AUZ95109.1 hypothetical protein [Agrobacterium phage Atu_ph07]